MERAQARRLQSLRSARLFITQHEKRLPDIVRLRERLDPIVERIERLVVEQEASRLRGRQATIGGAVLRRRLVLEHMTPIALIAREQLAEAQQLAPLRVPKGRPSPNRLAAAARGMAEAARAQAALLIGAGLREDFLQRLTEATNEFERASLDAVRCRGERRGATEGIRTGLAAGRRLVRVIDSLVKVAFADEPALLAEWGAVVHVERGATRRPAAEPNLPARSRIVARHWGALAAPRAYRHGMSVRVLPLLARVFGRSGEDARSPDPLLAASGTGSLPSEGVQRATAP